MITTKRIKNFVAFINEAKDEEEKMERYAALVNDLANKTVLQVIGGKNQDIKFKEVKFDPEGAIQSAIQKADDEADDDNHGKGHATAEWFIDYVISVPGQEEDVVVSIYFNTECNTNIEVSHGDNYVTPTEKFPNSEVESTEITEIYADGGTVELTDDVKRLIDGFNRAKNSIANIEDLKTIKIKN